MTAQVFVAESAGRWGPPRPGVLRFGPIHSIRRHLWCRDACGFFPKRFAIRRRVV